MQASIRAKQDLLGDAAQVDAFARATEEVVRRYKSGGRLYIAGNGGSAADAQHLAAEFISKLARDRAPLPAEALTTDSSILTAIGNDYGFEQVFARQIEGKASERDAFLAITTSGVSPNILRALEQCRKQKVLSVLFTGRDGGAAKALADFCIIAPGPNTNRIQEVHLVLAHSLCESVEKAMFP
ncbi:MAG: SIS domain-containing protein [Betaproteobacteria bacterium]|nr:SIS domain-containing protein [Betaproteobacteria bacterium]